MNKGFSLVELIVVIAIMAILIGVAVPVYTQYISKASEGIEAQTKEEIARALNTAMIDCVASNGSTAVPVSGSTITVSKNSVKVGNDDASTNYSAFAAAFNAIIDTAKLDAEYTFTVNANLTVSAGVTAPATSA